MSGHTGHSTSVSSNGIKEGILGSGLRRAGLPTQLHRTKQAFRRDYPQPPPHEPLTLIPSIHTLKMVRISAATLSVAALAGVAIANAQPIEYVPTSVPAGLGVESAFIFRLETRANSEQVADLVERGAFGRLGMILRPLLSQSVRQAGKTTVQGHAKANKVARDLDSDLVDLVDREFSEEDCDELVERGAFGRLGRILHPLFSQGVRQAGKTTLQGHAKANNAVNRREFEDFDDLLERDLTEDDITDLVERGAFGRLGMILRPLLSQSVRQAGKTAVQGHAKANKVVRRDLDLELDDLVERYFGEDEIEEWFDRSYGEESLEDMD
ncbi:hypothetical protein NMY22_g14590 [Coprinellus aureogranulatus]|nr:hypothetical protein NMY22_g14590 [Coprinellus aureogranulatus]